MAKYIEEGTNYSYIVKRMKDVNFRSLRRVSVDFTKRLPEDLSSELYKDIQHGVCQLQSEPELNMYIHALGMMHEAKLQHAFEHLAIDFCSHSSIDIIDYGCGQAIGTICYADFLREKGYSQNVRKITLIEPSELALKRATLHVSCFFPEAEIVTILKGFDDLVADDISVDGDVPTLHILSNVIDLADDCFNLEDFTTLIKKNIRGENHFICIEPYFNYDEEDMKLEHFVKMLDINVYYNNIFVKGTFVEGREWTCNVVIGKKIYGSFENIVFLASESYFDLTIKELIVNGAKIIRNCKIENVSYLDKEGNKIVEFVLAEPIRDYVLCEDGFNYKIGKTYTISFSIYAVFETLLEDDGFGWLGNIILYNPSVLNKVFQGATVDVLQQEVFKGEEYINPFLKSYKQKTIVLDKNFIVNHCIKFNLSEAGEKVGGDIMDVILGHINDENISLLMEFANNAKKQRRYKIAFDYYKLAAEKDYAEAQYCFGCCYYYGQGVDKNEVEAVKWYRKAAEQGDARAQLNLGLCYEYGQGVEKDVFEAVRWYRKSAEQGDTSAQCNLGWCYENGQGVEKNEFEAVKWYRQSAERGHARAQNNLGVCYENGKGVLKNQKEAVVCYLKSAEQGDATAQCNLGVCYECGRGVVKNDDEAIKWYIKAAKQGNKRADRKLTCIIDDINRFKKHQVRLDKILNAGINVSFIPKTRDIVAELNANKREFTVQEKELNRCIKAANLGYSKSQNCLGLYYIIKGNYKEAVKWLSLAAREGYPDSQFDLGYCLFYGYGIEKNEDEAINWYMKSAKQGYEPAKESLMGKDGDIDWLIKIAKKGYVDAQYKLGFLYQNGGNKSILFWGRDRYRVEQSYEKAISWYLRAVENGSVEAQVSLGLLYERGEGVEQSYEEAAKRYSLAAEQGSVDAKCNLARLYALGKGVDKSMTEALNLLNGYEKIERELYLIGRIFYEGVEVEKSYEDAIKWWHLAIEKDCKEAEFMLAVCYEKGYGVEQSYVEAIKWYLKVAENKYATSAQNIVGVFYEQGLGVEQSYKEAVKWYLKAVENGDKKAMFNLANCYRYGRGVERSYSNAMKWYKESNTEDAQQALKEIYDEDFFINIKKKILFVLGVIK